MERLTLFTYTTCVCCAVLHFSIPKNKSLRWTELAGSVTYRKSIFCYCAFLLGDLVTWSQKQDIVANSSAEAEFLVMADAVLNCVADKSS